MGHRSSTISSEVKKTPSDDTGNTRKPNRCYLCEKESERVVVEECGYQGKLCTCKLLYTDPQPDSNVFVHTIDLHPDDFYSFPAKYKANWMNRHCPNGRLLEVGCGKGHFLSAARELGYEVYGLEPQPDCARYAREVFNLPIEETYLENNQLPKKHYDVIYHCDMLAHFTDPKAALRSMVELLRPGGVLCFEVGILSGISPLWYRFVGRLGLEFHLWLYSYQALDLLFEKTKLETVHRKRFGLAPVILTSNSIMTSIRLARRIIGGKQPPADLLAEEFSHGARTTESLLKRVVHHFSTFMRYRVGAIAPNVGPQTLLYVLKPKEIEEASS